MNLSPAELMIILLVALIVLGPARLPEAARTLGKAMREIRKISTGFQDEVRHALEDADEEAAARDAGVPYRPAPGSPLAETDPPAAIGTAAEVADGPEPVPQDEAVPVEAAADPAGPEGEDPAGDEPAAGDARERPPE